MSDRYTQHVKPRRLSAQDWAQGAVQLWRGLFFGVTDIVEDVHSSVLRTIGRVNPIDRQLVDRTQRVYRGVREIGDASFIVADQAVGLAGALVPVRRGLDLGRSRLAVISALNGVLGDRMAAEGNPLAIRMGLHQADGTEVEIDREGLRRALGKPCKRLVVLVHGLGMNDQQWQRPGGPDLGARLVEEYGYSALYVRYNSGCHISENGRELAALLERLVERYPAKLQRLVIIGHSMGGLVARSATHYGREAGCRWPTELTELVCLGSPHLGAPLERLGSAFTHALTWTRFTAPFARIGNVRSAGVKDLRYGFLVDEDWRGRDPDHPEKITPRKLRPLEGTRNYLVAASLGRRHGDFADRWLGDLLVPIRSATGASRKPSRRLHFNDADGRIFFGMNHFEIMNHPQVYAALSEWLHGKSRGRLRQRVKQAIGS
ncbi:MAG: alpha/beta fold hydrolase [Salinisphaeraceae bacterium]